MELKSRSNKWLTVSPGVIVTPLADEVICLLDPIFGEHAEAREVSSGKRDQAAQLQLIINEAIKQRIVVTFGPQDYAKKEGDRYVWQQVWSEVLAYGFIVAPPFDAECLKDYKRPLISGFETIKAGTLRLASGHFYNDFDISGRRGKQTAADAGSIDDEMLVMKEAMNMKLGILSITPEKANGAVHVNLPRTL
jgi:hypothetical protein